MKIRTDHLEALRLEELKRRATPSGTGMFEDVLAKESAKDGAATISSSPTAVAAAPLAPLSGSVTGTEAAEPTTLTEREVMDHLDLVLHKWEEYAQGLKADAPGQNLRQAYGALESISGEVGKLKQALPGLPVASTNLKSVVEELEILTVTERFKFNRGDYL